MITLVRFSIHKKVQCLFFPSDMRKKEFGCKRIASTLSDPAKQFLYQRPEECKTEQSLCTEKWSARSRVPTDDKVFWAILHIEISRQ